MKAGDYLPSISLRLGKTPIALADYFQNRKGLLVGVWGAFEPKSSAVVKDLLDNIEKIRKVVDFVGVIACNDHHTLKAWSKKIDPDNSARFICDVDGRLSKRLGVSTVLSKEGFGNSKRCSFFTLLINEGAKIWSFDETDDLQLISNLLDTLHCQNVSNAAKIATFLEELDAKAQIFLERGIYTKVPPPELEYSYLNRGASWDKYSDLCDASDRQSPVDFAHTKTTPADTKPVFFSDSFTSTPDNLRTLTVSNNGQQVRVEGDIRGQMMIDADLYELSYINYKTPIEHLGACGPKHRPRVEMQMFFKPLMNSVLDVVGVSIMMCTGGRDVFLAALGEFECFPVAPGYSAKYTERTPNEFSFGNCFYEDKHFFMYSGSATSPPCTENITWFVSREPHYCSDEQYSELISIIAKCPGGNARMAQNLVGHARTPRMYKEVTSTILTTDE